jgi:hypothetical protein
MLFTEGGRYGRRDIVARARCVGFQDTVFSPPFAYQITADTEQCFLVEAYSHRTQQIWQACDNLMRVLIDVVSLEVVPEVVLPDCWMLTVR